MIASKMALPVGLARAINIAPPPLAPVINDTTALGGVPVEPSMSPGPVSNAHTGLFGRIGAFLGSDIGRSALLRSGAATLQGGLGEGIMAGANYVDHRRAEDTAAKQQGMENFFKSLGLQIQQQGVDQTGDYQVGQLGVAAANAEEAARQHVAQNRLTANGQAVTARGQTLSYQSAREGHAVTARGQDIGAATAERGQNLNSWNQTEGRTNARMIAGMNNGSRQTIAQNRAAGIGSKGPGSKLQQQAVVLPADATADDLTVGTIYRGANGQLGQWDGAGMVPVR